MLKGNVEGGQVQFYSPLPLFGLLHTFRSRRNQVKCKILVGTEEASAQRQQDEMITIPKGEHQIGAENTSQRKGRGGIASKYPPILSI